MVVKRRSLCDVVYERKAQTIAKACVVGCCMCVFELDSAWKKKPETEETKELASRLCLLVRSC